MGMELDTARIEAAIVTEVAAKMISDEELYARAKTDISAKVSKLWETLVEARIRTEVEASIAKGFDHEYQRVDTFGLPRGEKTTIRAELEKLIAGYWNAPVDKSGKPSDGYGTKLTRAEWLMTQMVAADFQGEMKQHVVNLGGSLKDKLRAELHDTVNKLLSEVFHVRSAEDAAQERDKYKFDGRTQTAPQ